MKAIQYFLYIIFFLFLGACVTTGPSQDIRYISGDSPAYPTTAQKDRVEGYALLSFTVTKKGDVKDVEVLEESPEQYNFGFEALNAAKSLRYYPQTVAGRPIKKKGVLFKYSFNLPVFSCMIHDYVKKNGQVFGDSICYQGIDEGVLKGLCDSKKYGDKAKAKEAENNRHSALIEREWRKGSCWGKVIASCNFIDPSKLDEFYYNDYSGIHINVRHEKCGGRGGEFAVY